MMGIDNVMNLGEILNQIARRYPDAAAALDKARDMVLAGVLADSLTLTDTAGGEAVKEWDINGESAVIGVKRV